MAIKRPSGLSKSYHDTFNSVNERVVEDISLEFFYKPHTITLLGVSIAAVVYSSFIRDERDVDANIRAGIYCVFFFFIIVSVLAFPNGPFTRPHPAVWRIVFGFSVLYLMLLVFCLFQNYKTVKQIIYWFDPELEHFHIDMDREYGVNCSVITFENLWNHMDVFALAHFLGWAFKALLVRHLGILWAVSVMWEFTEIAFAHLLPNFVECWWDALILDVLLCNGLGIWVGLRICKMLEMREYKWVSIRDIHSTTGKLKRAVLQFTPSDWMQVRWLDPSTTYMRFFAICQLVIFWQVCELNTFFLKHIFEMPPSHPLVYLRLLLVGIVRKDIEPEAALLTSTTEATPSEQYPPDSSNPNIHHQVIGNLLEEIGAGSGLSSGTALPAGRELSPSTLIPLARGWVPQCWVYGAIMATEATSLHQGMAKSCFGQTQATNICIWLLLIFLLSCLCVYGCVVWHRYFQTESDFSRETSPCKSPTSEFSETQSESSTGSVVKRALLFSSENSAEDVKRRHVNGVNIQS
ncbi:phosphatidylserine synthase-like [Homalodisca vitripennis]|nr:phosphatidylserine synthase-like [Homalodisca vitripennis]